MSAGLAIQGAVLIVLALIATAAYSHADIFQEPTKPIWGKFMVAAWVLAATSLIAAGWVWAIAEGRG